MQSRLTSQSLQTLLSTTNLSTSEIESLPLPKTELNTLSTLFTLSPSSIQSLLPSKFLLDPILDDLTSKLFELIEMFINVDNPSYPHPLSMGSIDNVATSAIRRCYMILCSKSTYPFILVNPELNYILSKLFLLIYKTYLSDPSILKPALSLYILLCIQLASFTPLVRFNVYTPFKDSTTWQQVFDTVIDFAHSHDIPLHKLERNWHPEDFPSN